MPRSAPVCQEIQTRNLFKQAIKAAINYRCIRLKEMPPPFYTCEAESNMYGNIQPFNKIYYPIALHEKELMTDFKAQKHIDRVSGGIYKDVCSVCGE